MTASAQDTVTDEEVDLMADKVIKALDRQMDRLGEPQADDDEAPRGLGIGTKLKAIGKKLADLVKGIWQKISKERVKKAVKSTITEVKNTLKEKGKEKIKELKEKLIKEGKKQAKSFLKHEILKFIKKKAANEFCSCPSALKCGCCMQPPAFEQGCFNLTALPEEQKFRIALNYGGEKIVGRKLSGTKEMMAVTKMAVPERLSSELFGPRHYATQIISGYGNLAAKLAGFGLRDEGNCTSGVP
ncbi:hypothetical protein AAG570_011659 [Ranatra chinensis]|uniref:Uncharacterized protein n=1 Tax=Ranatra chinensis TaxID=642074 RepID=A0ABD0YGH8_9HEMI